MTVCFYATIYIDLQVVQIRSGATQSRQGLFVLKSVASQQMIIRLSSDHCRLCPVFFPERQIPTCKDNMLAPSLTGR